MTKKQLAEYKRQLKESYEKDPEGYDRWKEVFIRSRMASLPCARRITASCWR